MKRKIGMVASLALLGVGALAGGASADCTAVWIKFDADAFAYETAFTPQSGATPPTSAAGSQLDVVGIVSLFGGAYSDLNASAPGTEYTFHMDGLTTAAGTQTTPVAGGATRYTTLYAQTPATFSIYEDSPRDAPTAAGGMPPNPPVAGSVPDRFVDGTLIVTGTLSNFTTIITRFASGTYSGSFRADFTVTGPIGGQYYNRVQGTTCIVGGAWVANGTAPGLSPLPAGYSAHPNGKWDGPATTETISSTWGAIKQLYR